MCAGQVYIIYFLLCTISVDLADNLEYESDERYDHTGDHKPENQIGRPKDVPFDIHRRVGFHATVIIGNEKDHKLDDMDKIGPVILCSTFERQVYHIVQDKT